MHEKKKHEDERSVCFAFLSLRLYFFSPSSGNLGFQRTIFVPFLSLGYMGEREGCREKRCCSLWRYMIDRLGAPARTQFRRPSALTHPSELHLLCRIERAGSFHTISSSLNLIEPISKPFPIMTRLRLRVFLFHSFVHAPSLSVCYVAALISPFLKRRHFLTECGGVTNMPGEGSPGRNTLPVSFKVLKRELSKVKNM